MQRHRYFSSGLWMLLATAILASITSCSQAPDRVSLPSGVRDNGSITLYENSFDREEDWHPTLPGSTLNYIKMSNTTSGTFKAYAVDCRGKNLAEIATAFGLDASSLAPGHDSYAVLDDTYAISKQPVLRCSSAVPNPSNASISNVFQLIDDRSAEEKTKAPYPDLFVRFSNLTADDAVDQEQFYSIGCRNILNVLGTSTQKSLADAIPILASTVNSVFPNFKNYDPLNCLASTQPPLLGQASKKMEDLEPRGSKALIQNNMEFYRVVDALNPARSVSYLLGQGNDFRRLICYNVGADEIKKALNSPAHYPTIDMPSDDDRYLNSRNQPELECVSIESKNKFDQRWSTVQESPAVNYYKKKDSKTLYRFGCLSAEKYFADGLTLAQPDVKVTSQLIDYLSQSNNSGYKLVTFPCYDAGFTVDGQIFKNHEVISLKTALPNSTNPWLGGTTRTGVMSQVPAQYTGTFWLVESTGEPGSFYLQSLGTDVGVNYLACPAEGPIPQMVKTKTQAGFSTRWTTYTGDGSSSLRLGCKSASGQVHLLNGENENPTLSDESTVNDLSTSWVVQHQTFVEDTTILTPGKIVSIYSPTTDQDNRWLAAYPGSAYEMGLDLNNLGASASFRVEARTDNRGVSLRTLNFGGTDRYLDCKTEVEKLWMELAPMSTGAYYGTGFKVYRLTNSTSPIFKLACFDFKNNPRWVSISGRFPYLNPDAAVGISRADAILYPQFRAKEPVLADVKPRTQKMARTNIVFDNKCADTFDLVVLSFDTAWTTKVTTLKTKTKYTVPVQNEYTYWYSTAHMTGAKTEITALYKKVAQKTVELVHKRTNGTGTPTLVTSLNFCG